MPKCIVCHHPDRHTIDCALLAEDVTYASLSEQYGISISGLYRHKLHLRTKIYRARERLRDNLSLGRLLKLNNFLAQIENASRAADAEGNAPVVLKAANVGTRIISCIDKMVVPLSSWTVYRLLASPQWTSQDSLLPTDPKIFTDTHQAIASSVFSPCMYPAPEPGDNAAEAEESSPEGENESPQDMWEIDPCPVFGPGKPPNLWPNEPPPTLEPSSPPPDVPVTPASPGPEAEPPVAHQKPAPGKQPPGSQNAALAELAQTLPPDILAALYQKIRGPKSPAQPGPEKSLAPPAPNQREKSAKLSRNSRLLKDIILLNQRVSRSQKMSAKNPPPGPGVGRENAAPSAPPAAGPPPLTATGSKTAPLAGNRQPETGNPLAPPPFAQPPSPGPDFPLTL